MQMDLVEPLADEELDRVENLGALERLVLLRARRDVEVVTQLAKLLDGDPVGVPQRRKEVPLV